MAKKKTKIIDLDEMFNGDLYTHIDAKFGRLKFSNHGTIRDMYDIFNRYIVTFNYHTWTDEDEEIDDNVAFMILNVARFNDISHALYVADADGGDEFDSVEVANSLINKIGNDFVEEMALCTEYMTICELHNFYISPKYRGKKIADALMAKIPNILLELGYPMAIITTYVHPFTNQDIELTDSPDKIYEQFGGYSEDKEKSKEMTEKAIRQLKRCGFIECYDNHFAATTDMLNELCHNNGITVEEYESTWYDEI